jgi:hypothetical protein
VKTWCMPSTASERIPGAEEKMLSSRGSEDLEAALFCITVNYSVLVLAVYFTPSVDPTFVWARRAVWDAALLVRESRGNRKWLCVSIWSASCAGSRQKILRYWRDLSWSIYEAVQ